MACCPPCIAFALEPFALALHQLMSAAFLRWVMAAVNSSYQKRLTTAAASSSCRCQVLLDPAFHAGHLIRNHEL